MPTDMFATAYEPLARDDERRIPHYTPISWHAGELDPLDTFTRPSVDVPPSEASHDDDLIAPTSLVNPIPRQPVSRFPLVTARTFPTYNHDPWAAIRRSQAFEPPKYTPSAELPPPEYAMLDAQARTFRLRAPFVYASKTSNLPRYQIAQVFDRQGEPSTIKLRRLRPSETRACSVPALNAGRAPRIQYDDEETISTMSGIEMSGPDFAGSVQITSGRTLWGGNWTKVWHVSKSKFLRRESWSSLSRPRSFEGDKVLLYTIKKGVWEDADGTVVAREAKDNQLDIGQTWADLKEKRDLLVGCWVLRVWGAGCLEWDGDGDEKG